MNLHITFDDDLAKPYLERGKSPLAYMHWDFDGLAYPAMDWMDFAAIVLSWWLVKSRNLILGSCAEEFPFMDGPFSILANADGENLVLRFRGNDVVISVGMRPFVESIVAASELLSQEMRNRQIADAQSLAVGVADVTSALNGAKS